MAGRPATVSKDVFRETLLNYKSSIIVEKKVTVKTDPIWKEISICLKNKIQARSIYSMVCDNRYDVLNLLLEKKENDLDSDITDTSLIEQTENPENLPGKSGFYNSKTIEFTIEIPKESFDDMTREVLYQRETKQSVNRKRKYVRFIPGVWQPYFNKVFFDSFQVQCGLNYLTQNITIDKLSGNFTGTYLINFTLKSFSSYYSNTLILTHQKTHHKCTSLTSIILNFQLYHFSA